MSNIKIQDENLKYISSDLSYGGARILQACYIDDGVYPIVIDKNNVFVLSDRKPDSFAINSDGKYYIESREDGKLTGLFSIANHRLLDVNNEKVSMLYNYMFYNGRTYDLAHMLLEINDRDLNIYSSDERKQFVDYLTSGNRDISHDQVVSYILSVYPKLKEYTKVQNGFSLLEYLNICKLIGTTTPMIKSIPQDLDFLQYDDSINESLRKIYIKDGQKNRILSLKKK